MKRNRVVSSPCEYRIGRYHDAPGCIKTRIIERRIRQDNVKSRDCTI